MQQHWLKQIGDYFSQSGFTMSSLPWALFFFLFLHPQYRAKALTLLDVDGCFTFILLTTLPVGKRKKRRQRVTFIRKPKSPAVLQLHLLIKKSQGTAVGQVLALAATVSTFLLLISCNSSKRSCHSPVPTKDHCTANLFKSFIIFLKSWDVIENGAVSQMSS